MIIETKTFRSGNSQAIRIPKEVRLKSKKAYIKKINDGILLIEESNDFWNNWWKSFDKLDIKREQDNQKREDLF